jgi:YVTN family beta-propeller protein
MNFAGMSPASIAHVTGYIFMAYESAVINVDETPHSAASSADGSHVYVSHFLPGSISVIDTARNAVERKIPVTPGLYGIATHPNNQYIYVAENDSDAVKRIDLSADRDISIRAGIGARPYGLAMNREGTWLFATAPLNDTIEVLDPLVKNFARINYEGFPVQLAVSSDGSLLYVTEYFAGTVAILDISRLAAGDINFNANVVGSISVSANPYGISLSVDGSLAYVAHFGSENVVSVIDIKGQEVVDTIRIDHGLVRGVTATPDGGRIYVTNYFSSSVSVLDI